MNCRECVDKFNELKSELDRNIELAVESEINKPYTSVIAAMTIQDHAVDFLTKHAYGSYSPIDSMNAKEFNRYARRMVKALQRQYGETKLNDTFLKLEQIWQEFNARTSEAIEFLEKNEPSLSETIHQDVKAHGDLYGFYKTRVQKALEKKLDCSIDELSFLHSSMSHYMLIAYRR